MGIISLIGGLILLFFIQMLFAASRYKKCPPDKILVVYGKLTEEDKGNAIKCLRGGAAFVWPVIQNYAYLDLTPIQLDVNLRDAFGGRDIRVDSPSRFTVSISEKEGVTERAAQHLLGLDTSKISRMAQDIITTQIRMLIPKMNEADIHDAQKLQELIQTNIEPELANIGLKLINANVKVAKMAI